MNTDHIPGPRSVNCNHPVFSGNADNFIQYEKVINMNIFQGRGENGFVNHAMGAIDKSISDLHGLEDVGNMFAFHNNRPRTRDDVMKLLFKEGSQGMIAMQEKKVWRGCCSGVEVCQHDHQARSKSEKVRGRHTCLEGQKRLQV